MNIDNIDRGIINMLQKNARTPLSEVGKTLNVSLPTVSKRVSKLEISHIINQFTTILNPAALDKSLLCFCFVILRNKTPHNDRRFFEFVNRQPDILECHCISGDYEFLLKIVTNSPKSLEHLIADMRKESFVTRTNTFIALSSIKENPSICLDLDIGV